MVIKMELKTIKQLTAITVGILMCIATLVGALAGAPLPYPVAGKITLVGDIMPLFEVQLITCEYGSTADNCIEDIVTKFDTDSTGHYIFALDDINPVYRPRWCNSKGTCYTGDFVKIKVCNNHPKCEVIKEVAGTAIEVAFNFGEDGEVIETEKIVEKIIEVPVENDKGEDVDVVIAGEKTTVERMIASKLFPWITGFLALVLFFMGTQIGRAKKMYATFIKKHNKKGYGK